MSSDVVCFHLVPVILLKAVVLSFSALNMLAIRINLSSFPLEENNIANIKRNQFCMMKRSVPFSARLCT